MSIFLQSVIVNFSSPEKSIIPLITLSTSFDLFHLLSHLDKYSLSQLIRCENLSQPLKELPKEPLISISPIEGVVTLDKILSNVDFPAPLDPIIPKISPYSQRDLNF